ncbi:hypothetical protein FRUB_01076 [Fimbriiglobus ruber]|uniref:Uncharacterized protein n=1 Tax=Fimbriiglobus ruber TaxID=1908690 RepID=A0A225EGN8_9BACT|nr:hypothetical protein FRUB_01076 [Fimbriiglobus ruber]
MIAERLGGVGQGTVVRMIDGLPAFPDEIPSPGWRELRVGLDAGMVTVRVTGPDIQCVVWGNADAGLVRAWNLCCWAVAAAGGGVVVEGDGTKRTAEEFWTEVSSST